MKLPGITDLPPELQKPFADFVRSYHDWRLNGAPEGRPYWRRQGFCYSAWLVNPDLSDTLSEAFWEISGTNFPFGEDNFLQRLADKTQHLDPARIAYEGEIIKQAKEMGI